MSAKIAAAFGAALLIVSPVQAQQPAPVPEAAEEPPARPPRARARQPRPPASIAVSNATANVATEVVVTAEEGSASLARPLAPRARATLRLPRMTGCTVAVKATFEGEGVVDVAAFDVCKERTIRFTE